MEAIRDPVSATTQPTNPVKSHLWLAFVVLLQGAVMAVLNVGAIVPAITQIEQIFNIGEQPYNYAGLINCNYETCQSGELRPPWQLDLAVWFYAVVFVLAILGGNRILHRVGYRRTALLALTLFTIGSFGASLTGSHIFHLTPDLNWLLYCRLAQALGGGAMLALAFALGRKLHLRRSCQPDLIYYPDRCNFLVIATCCIAAFGGVLLGSFYGSAVLSRFTDWYWLYLLNFFFGVGTIALLNRLMLPGEDTEEEMGVGIWLAFSLVFIVLAVLQIHHHPIIYMVPHVAPDFGLVSRFDTPIGGGYNSSAMCSAKIQNPKSKIEDRCAS